MGRVGEQKEVLDSDILKARITKLEYGEVDADGNFTPISVEDIRRVYIEETRQEPPETIKLYRSDDFRKDGRDSGFDGTVIHFYDRDKGINQSYTITRGSESAESGGAEDGQPLDWMYNGLGIFTGKVNDQLKDAIKFEKWANQEIQQFIANDNADQSIEPLQKYGLGHSLGGNHIQMLLLLRNSFDEVFVMNDAAPTVYQLASNDRLFFEEIRYKFGPQYNDVESLYEIDPKALQSFALTYYQSKGIHIHHITSEEDALYPLHLTRGFLRFGSERVIDTNPELPGLHDIINRIPDKELQSLQQYLASAAPYYEEAGMDGLYHFATGIDNRFLQNLSILLTGNPDIELKLDLKNISKYLLANPFKRAKNRFVAFQEIVAQLPIIQERLQELVKQIPTLLILADAMSGEEGRRISDYLKSIQERATQILQLLTVISTFDITSLRGFMDSWKGLRTVLGQLQGIIGDFYLLWESGKGLLSDLAGSFEAHGLQALVNGLSDPSRRYVGNDLVYAKGSGADRIEVNVSSATRLYWLGIDNYEKKRLVLEKIQRAYTSKFEQPFEWRKRELLNRIHEMESNPHAYSYLLGGGDREMVSISVHETIPPMPVGITNDMQGIYRFYTEDIEKGRRLFEEMKEAILQFFSQDQQLTAIFELR